MKIYVIIQEYNDGCSITTTHCGFTFSESRAKDKVAELTKLDKLYLKICEEICEKQSDWEEANPYPTTPLLERHSLLREITKHLIDDVTEQYSLEKDVADIIECYPGFEYSYSELSEM